MTEEIHIYKTEKESTKSVIVKYLCTNDAENPERSCGGIPDIHKLADSRSPQIPIVFLSHNHRDKESRSKLLLDRLAHLAL